MLLHWIFFFLIEVVILLRLYVEEVDLETELFQRLSQTQRDTVKVCIPLKPRDTLPLTAD